MSTLPPHRVDSLPAMKVAGISARYSYTAKEGIPAQWDRMRPHLGHVPGQAGRFSYGVCYGFDGKGQFNYVCGVEISGAPSLPSGFVTVELPSRRYVVWAQPGNISTIQSMYEQIFPNGVAAAGYKAAPAPCFERYTDKYNPADGSGGFEIWVPIEG